MNRYENVMDDWQVRLIRRCARRLGLRGPDLDDVAQRIAVETASFTFRPERSNGASPRTVLTALVHRQLQAEARRGARYRRCMDRYKQGNSPVAMGVRPTHELELDVRTAVAQLSHEEQRVCGMLAEGQSLASIAGAMGCGWHTVQRIVAGIRVRFRAIGLDGWLGD